MMETVHTSATKDPSYIVIDEVVGSCVTFFCVPLSGYFLLAGFILFRFFDIYKPCGVVFLEQLPGAFGVVCDDILAGLYALLMLQLGSYFLL